MNSRKMKCPCCGLQISLEETYIKTWELYDDIETPVNGISFGNCPACENLIVIFSQGELFVENLGSMVRVHKENSYEIIYPKFPIKNIEPEIPDRYKKDFLEAFKILQISPKASAALSRRILQDLFREELGIHKPSLAQEIDEFIQRTNIPSYLTDAVDAVRNIGNLAAHPLKDTNTGQIVEVEAGEAEWLLEVNEALFDFVFVQPRRLEERKNNLNTKLASLGKPPMKS